MGIAVSKLEMYKDARPWLRWTSRASDLHAQYSRLEGSLRYDVID